MNVFINLSILVIILAVRESTACSCMPTHPQDQFCRADYVIRAKVITKTTIYPQREPTPEPPTPSKAPLDPRDNDPLFEVDTQRQADFAPIGLGGLFPYHAMSDPNRPLRIEYTVKVEKIYKGDSLLVSGTVAKISTPPDDGICGVTHLEPKQRMLFSGSLRNGDLQIRTCDFVKEFTALTKRQKQGLKYHWKKECNDCKIGICFGSYCPSHPIPNTCMLDVAPSDYTCETNLARCTRDKDNTCFWHGKKDYKQCQEMKNSRPIVEESIFMP